MKYFFGLLLLLSYFSATAQRVIPTKGTDFWIGFPYSPGFSSANTKRFELFITSDVNTTGSVSIPQQGWTQTFTVSANNTTTISIPLALAEHIASEVIENKGVQVLTQDTVSVFAITFVRYTADATVVYPKGSLGTTYRTCNYPGLSSSITSELLIVATEDGTQIDITPACGTKGGRPAGIPFSVSLNAGESYQVLADSARADLTGTYIEGSSASGSCRPFAVFSGSTCVNIPNGCTACDILYEQSLPVNNWGRTYYAAPFSFASNYTLRILADQNNTSFTIDAGPPLTLNAGQYIEINNITGTQCINSNKPICVAQYMQGLNCAGAGDPSMLFLNAEDQKIDRVTFSTVTSTVINQHNVNVFMNAAHIGQLTLDGNPVPASSFNPLNACSHISYAQLSLTQGSHTLAADSGFTAYIYGTGSFESYGYSAGSFSKTKPIQVDTFFCSSDTIMLGTSNILFSPWWSTMTNPDDTIATGAILTLTSPIIPDIYIEHGNEFLSGCEIEYYFQIEIPTPPQIQLSSSATIACQTQNVQLNVNVSPASSIYEYAWSPSAGLNNPNIANPVLTASTSQWYHVAVSSPSGCAPTVYDSIFIDVLTIPLPSVSGGANQSMCLGSSVTLSASGGNQFLWVPTGDTTASITVSPTSTTDYIVYVTDTNGCGNSDTVRVLVSQLPVANAGVDQDVCEGTGVTLTASGGVSYSWITTGDSTSSISVSPQTTTQYIVSVMNANGCADLDSVIVNVNALPLANAGPDQVYCGNSPIVLNASGGTAYHWMPGNFQTASIQVTPAATTSYVVQVMDANNCVNFDTVVITVMPFVSGTSANRSMCFGDMITLSDSGGVTYLWNPGGSIDSSVVVSPPATTSYVVQIVSSNGCRINDTVHVTVNPLPPAFAGNDVSVCAGSSTTLAASGGISYNWLTTGANTSSITVTPVMTEQYVVRVQDQNGCNQTDSVIVTVNPLPVASAGPDVFICPGDSITIFASGGIAYSWLPGSIPGPQITIAPDAPTEYFVEVSDMFGCKDTDNVWVFFNPSPAAEFEVSPGVCDNELTFFKNKSSVLSGNIPFNNWRFGDGTSSISQDVIHRFHGTGSYDVWLHAVSDRGCKDSIHHVVVVNPKPVVGFMTQNKCRFQPAEFTDTSMISVGAIVKQIWDFGDGETVQGKIAYHAYTHEGAYDVSLMVISDSGCISVLHKPHALQVYPLPISDFSFYPSEVNITDALVDFRNASSGMVDWRWDFGDEKGISDLLNPTYRYSDTGSFEVQLIVRNIFNCLDTATGRIYVEPFFTVYFPNAFTPNGDNVNDYFAPLGEGISKLELYIYDRWGNEVFSSTGPPVAWNGIAQNGKSQAGEAVYVYLARVFDYKGIEHEYRGSVTLMR